jgi:hypothetical protein
MFQGSGDGKYKSVRVVKGGVLELQEGVDSTLLLQFV